MSGIAGLVGLKWGGGSVAAGQDPVQARARGGGGRGGQRGFWDPAEVEAWVAELKYITPGQYAQSEYTADRMRK
jgi:hypothetical protein